MICLNLLHDDYVFFQLDFWREVRDVATPVDIRVPLHSLQSFKAFLETQDLEYSVMIEDLQVRGKRLDSQVQVSIGDEFHLLYLFRFFKCQSS